MNSTKPGMQEKPGSSIAARLRYSLVAVALASVLLTGGVLTQIGFRLVKAQTQQLQQERSRTAASEISAYLDGLQRQLNYLSELRGLTGFPQKIQRSLLEGLVKSNSAYEIVGILDRQGQIVEAMSPYKPISTSDLSVATGSNSPLFIETFQEGNNYVSSLEIDPEIQLPVATLAVPIRNERDRIEGVLFAKINLNFLLPIVGRANVGKTGYLYVLDDSAVAISKQGKSIDELRLQSLKDRSFVQDLLKLARSPDPQASIAYQGLNGEQVFGAATLVRRMQWTVVVELPAAEVYAPIRQMIFVMGTASLVFAAGAIGIAIAFSKSIALPLQTLTAVASHFSLGYLDRRVKIDSRDELGVLANAFNQMAQQLQEYFASLELKNDELKALNHALTDSERRLMKFLDAIPVGVFVTDATGQPFYTNETGKQIFGQGVVESGTSAPFQAAYSGYVAGSDRLYPKEREPLFKALQGEKLTVDDMEIRHCDRIVPIESSGAPIYDESGQISFAIATFTDITDRKQAEKLLAEYNQNLERQVSERTAELEHTLAELQRAQSQLIHTEKMSSLGQIVAGVAHEINNPISFIYGNLGYADEYVKNLLDVIEFYHKEYPESQSKFEEIAEEIEWDFLVADLPKLLASMKGGAERIRQIVLSLRTFSRLDESAMKPIDIHEGLESALMLLQHRLAANEIRPEIQLIKDYGELPIVTCYASQLNQVFMNIISNAIEAFEMNGQGDTPGNERTAKGGESRLEREAPVFYSLIPKSQSPIPTIYLCTHAINSTSVKIIIADNGPGMNPEVHKKIFDPFFTTKAIGSGTGLGLSISHTIIVEKHGGQLSCNTDPDRGTEFIIEIPIASSSI